MLSGILDGSHLASPQRAEPEEIHASENWSVCPALYMCHRLLTPATWYRLLTFPTKHDIQPTGTSTLPFKEV